MKTELIVRLLTLLLSLVPDGWIVSAVDALLDEVEDLVERTSTPIDDAIVLPIIDRLRAELSIPDGDD